MSVYNTHGEFSLEYNCQLHNLLQVKMVLGPCRATTGHGFVQRASS